MTRAAQLQGARPRSFSPPFLLAVFLTCLPQLASAADYRFCGAQPNPVPVSGVVLSHLNYGQTRVNVNPTTDCQFDLNRPPFTCLLLVTTFDAGNYLLEAFSRDSASSYVRKLQPLCLEDDGATPCSSPDSVRFCNTNPSLHLKSLQSTDVNIFGIRTTWEPVCSEGREFSSSLGKCVTCPSGTYQDVSFTRPTPKCKTKRTCPWGTKSEGSSTTDRTCIEHICEINFANAEKYINLRQTVRAGTTATPYGYNSRCYLTIPDFPPTLGVRLTCNWDTQPGYDFFAAIVTNFPASSSNIGYFVSHWGISGQGSSTWVVRGSTTGFFNLVWYTDYNYVGAYGFACYMTIINVDPLT